MQRGALLKKLSLKEGGWPCPKDSVRWKRCEQLPKCRCADRRKPTVESMPRDEIRKKIVPWWFSAEKCGIEKYTGHMSKSERGAGR